MGSSKDRLLNTREITRIILTAVALPHAKAHEYMMQMILIRFKGTLSSECSFGHDNYCISYRNSEN